MSWRNAWPLIKGTAFVGGGTAATTAGVLDAYKDEDWVGRLRDFYYPPNAPTPQPEADEPRMRGWRMGSTAEPAAYDEQAMTQDAREMAARRVRGELAPSAAVERRFGEFAAPSPPPAPTRADAYRMGGLADMSDYREAPRDFYKKLDVAGAERDVSPDPYMNPFAASPQQTRVAETHAAVPDALLIPTSPLDVGLMAMGPAGKLAGVPGKVAALTAGLYGSGIDPAEAGPIGKVAKGIRAYHSSPHDFDKFDLSKIGTGEGAQSYGHGLYFSENPAVSGQGGQYWDQFARNRFAYSPTPEGMATRALLETKADRAAAIAKLSNPKYQEHLRYFLPNSYFKDVEPRDALRLLESGAPVGPRTYEVNINARPDLFLDWDKPLKQQPVAEAVRSLVPRDLRGPFDANVESGVSGANAYHNYVPGERYSIRETRTSPYAASNARTMEEALQTAGNDPGRVLRIRDPSYVSETLRDAGIPGIRYLDQGSRPAANLHAQLLKDLEVYERSGNKTAVESIKQQLANPPQGTSNYVVFDDKLIDIMRKYGLAGLTAGGGMGGLAAQDEYR